MARKSRKSLQVEHKKTPSESLYRTAIYARLSIEDNGVQGDSIENQVAIIEKYIRKIPELKVIDTFVDNGATGVNFVEVR